MKVALNLKMVKPEKLLERIIKMCSDPGDLVLDSFHVLNYWSSSAQIRRKWIMIELENIVIHILFQG